LTYLGTAQTGASNYHRAFAKLGSQFQAKRDREYFIYSSVLSQRDKAEETLTILSNILRDPDVYRWDFDPLPKVLSRVRGKLNKQSCVLINEAIHQESFRNQPLGRSLYPVWNVDSMTFPKVESFRKELLNSATVVGMGIKHEKLVEYAHQIFSQSLQPAQAQKTNTFTGGNLYRIFAPLKNGTQVALIFRGESIDGKDSLTFQVLAKLLGEGQSQSMRPKPGQGLTSHFGQFVANNSWLLSARAVNLQYSDSGLFALLAHGQDAQANRLPQVLLEQLSNVVKNISDSQLTAAKNQVSFDYLNRNEQEQFDFLVSQGGKTVAQYVEPVNNITKGDVERILKNMLQIKPAVVGYGDVENLVAL